jgi:hypothetical protein
MTPENPLNSTLGTNPEQNLDKEKDLLIASEYEKNNKIGEIFLRGFGLPSDSQKKLNEIISSFEKGENRNPDDVKKSLDEITKQCKEFFVEKIKLAGYDDLEQEVIADFIAEILRLQTTKAVYFVQQLSSSITQPQDFSFALRYLEGYGRFGGDEIFSVYSLVDAMFHLKTKISLREYKDLKKEKV